MIAAFDLVSQSEANIPFGSEQVATRCGLLDDVVIKAVYVHGIIGRGDFLKSAARYAAAGVTAGVGAAWPSAIARLAAAAPTIPAAARVKNSRRDSGMGPSRRIVDCRLPIEIFNRQCLESGAASSMRQRGAPW